MKRIILILLSVCMLLSITACNKPSGEGKDTADETTEANTVVEDVCPLPELDYDLESVTIHVRSDVESIAEIGLEDEGTLLSSALYDRTMRTEERLNVEIKIAKGDTWADYWRSVATLRSSIQSGNASYDIISGWMAKIPTLAAEGLFQNLLDYKFIDPAAEWWSESAVKSLEVNDCLYMMTGDISTCYMDSCMMIGFNQKLANAYGYDYSDFYDIVDTGDWTMEYLYMLSKDCYRDNGNQERDAEDTFGLITSSAGCDAFWDGCDISIIKNNADGRPVFDYDVEKIQSAYDLLYQLVIENEGAVLNNGEAGDIKVSFREGKALFSVAQFAHLYSWNDMEDDYGILPIPKYDTAQEDYHTMVWYNVSMFSIPRDAKNGELSSAVLTSMAYDSNRMVIKVHYEDLLKARYTRDLESAYMIDLIYNSISLDFDNVWNESLTVTNGEESATPVYIFRKYVYKAVEGNVSSWWGTYGEALTTALDNLVDLHYANNEA